MRMKFKGPFWPKKLNIIRMEPKKDIFDLFKDNEHKLAEQPAPHVWRRLERKLDSNRKRNRTVRIRPSMGQFGIAAGILLLFTVITIMTLALPNRKTNVLAQQEEMIFEELIASEADKQLLKVVEFTRRHESRLSNPVEESNEKKIILPAQSTKVILLDRQ